MTTIVAASISVTRAIDMFRCPIKDDKRRSVNMSNNAAPALHAVSPLLF